MSATTTYQQAPRRLPGDIYPKGAFRRIGAAILRGLARIGERSAAGRSAEMYRRLSALSDRELADIGLTRSELAVRCFGPRALY